MAYEANLRGEASPGSSATRWSRPPFAEGPTAEGTTPHHPFKALPEWVQDLLWTTGWDSEADLFGQ
eukprot:8011008-Heterocapsa_arctica.AAC.1